MDDSREAVTAERQRWIEMCRKTILNDSDTSPQMDILRHRLDWIVDEMEDFEIQANVVAERNVWTAMFRDVNAFPSQVAEDVEKAIEMLYALSDDMNRV